MKVIVVIADSAAPIRFSLHKEFRAAEISFYLHKEFRAAGIRFYLHKLAARFCMGAMLMKMAVLQ